MNVAGSRAVVGFREGSAICSSSIRTAVRPISAIGCATVVTGGSTRSAQSTSSYPASEAHRVTTSSRRLCQVSRTCAAHSPSIPASGWSRHSPNASTRNSAR